jgi:hypothetical protein
MAKSEHKPETAANKRGLPSSDGQFATRRHGASLGQGSTVLGLYNIANIERNEGGLS